MTKNAATKLIEARLERDGLSTSYVDMAAAIKSLLQDKSIEGLSGVANALEAATDMYRDELVLELDDPTASFLCAPVRLGLGQQGHIPTIEKMLAEKKTWKEIGDAIGWCGKTAEQHYGWYLEAKAKAKEKK